MRAPRAREDTHRASRLAAEPSPAAPSRRPSCPETRRLDAAVVHYEWNNAIPPRLVAEPGDTLVLDTRDAADGYYTPASTSRDTAARAAREGPSPHGPDRACAAPGRGRPGRRHPRGGAGAPSAGRTSARAAGSCRRPTSRSRSCRSGTSRTARSRGCAPIGRARGRAARAVSRRPGHRAGRARRPQHDAAPEERRQHGHQAAHRRHDALPPGVGRGRPPVRVGDAHGAQGDGEVCISAVEMSARVTLRFGLRQGPPAPRAPVPDRRAPAEPRAPSSRRRPTAPTSSSSAQQAVRYMIEHLVAERGLTPRGGLRRRERRRGPPDQRDRRRAELDRLGVPAGGDLRLESSTTSRRSCSSCQRARRVTSPRSSGITRLRPPPPRQAPAADLFVERHRAGRPGRPRGTALASDGLSGRLRSWARARGTARVSSLTACRRLGAHVRPAAPRPLADLDPSCPGLPIPCASGRRDRALNRRRHAGRGERRCRRQDVEWSRSPWRASSGPAGPAARASRGAMAVVSTPSEFSVTGRDRWPRYTRPVGGGHGRAELPRSRLPRGPVSGLPSAAGRGSRPPPSAGVLRPHPVRRRRGLPARPAVRQERVPGAVREPLRGRAGGVLARAVDAVPRPARTTRGSARWSARPSRLASWRRSGGASRPSWTACSIARPTRRGWT